ncbi:MAG TPA: X2-like carbohydrate binding domain-containing protein [Clostridia bacterium]
MHDESKKLKLLVGIGVILMMQILLWTGVFAQPVMKRLDTNGMYDDVSVEAINGKGQVIGNIGQFAAVWQNTKLVDVLNLGYYSVPVAINERGQVIGCYDSASDTRHGFIWESGKITDLGTLGGNLSLPIAINENGQVIGVSNLPDNKTQHGFIWENGKITDLGTLGGDFSCVAAINEKGQVIGDSYLPDNKTMHSFIWEKGKMIDLVSIGVDWSNAVAINENGQVIGEYSITGKDEKRGFIWENGKMTDLGLGGSSSEIRAINEKGQVIGKSFIAGDKEIHGFMWDNGKMTDLGTLEGEAYGVRSINKQGQVIGYSYVGGESHGFIWDNGKKAVLDTPGDKFCDVIAINDKGQVIGDFNIDNKTQHGFMWENGKGIDLGTLGGHSRVVAINKNGQIIGTSSMERKIDTNGSDMMIGGMQICGFIWEDTPAEMKLNPSEIHVDQGQLSDISLNTGDNELESIMNGAASLIPNVDYKTSGNVVTISRWYLNYYFTRFPNQNLYLKFNFASGNSTMLTVYIGDTPHVVMTDSLSYKLGSNDAEVNLVPNGNFITSVKNGDSILVPRIDYTFVPSINTFIIRKGYLNSYFTKTSELLKLTVSFTGDAPKTAVINPVK